jgi:hypothetical protein
MIQKSEPLTRHILHLPQEERIKLLEQLMLSLQPEGVQITEFWADEAVKRRDEMLSESAEKMPFSEAIRQIRG